MGRIVCRTCGDKYDDFADGFDGECPRCADAREELNEAIAAGSKKTTYRGHSIDISDDANGWDYETDTDTGRLRSRNLDDIINEIARGIFFDPEDRRAAGSSKGRVVPGSKCRRCGTPSTGGRYCPRGCGPI